MTFAIEHRRLTLVNTDPQRRCYDGYHYKSEWRWTQWSELETWDKRSVAVGRLQFWRDLTDYAVRERGKPATKEYRVVEKDKTHA